jgi:hypothetical protein
MLFFGLLLLFGTEILRVYFIMPFPGSQKSDTVTVAYWLGNNITWIRLVALALLASPLINIFKNGSKWMKILVSLLLVLYAVIFFFVNFRFEADKMFYQPRKKSFIAAEKDTAREDRLVLGVVINGEAKAYPLEIIGYHHQVRDSIGNTPVMITYCTVCRTGRAFSPFVKGHIESFRLVGMDHFNAMFEDMTTKSWWQQATGVAVAGPLKGEALKEIPTRQVALDVWLREYPQSGIMEPDTFFKKQYNHLAGYDKGTINNSLEKRDSLSWKPKSWIVGVVHDQASKAYDWNMLTEKRVIQDSIEGIPIVVALENDTVSFHVFSRLVDSTVLDLQRMQGDTLLSDRNTGSSWNMDGLCIKGSMKDKRLAAVQAYNEFWHSWQTFHPGTKRYTE